MRKILLLIIFVAACFELSAQSNQRAYSYDAAGNRISRSVIVLRSLMQPVDSVSEKIEKEGISKSLSECVVTAYPNPTQGEVLISITGGDEDLDSKITVYSNSGKLLMTRKALGNTSVSIDLSSYPSGYYLIDFQQGETRSYYKIIKQ